jgi:hypothetical protein
MALINASRFRGDKPVLQPHLGSDDAGQPVAPAVRLDGLRASVRLGRIDLARTQLAALCGTIPMKLLLAEGAAGSVHDPCVSSDTRPSHAG